MAEPLTDEQAEVPVGSLVEVLLWFLPAHNRVGDVVSLRTDPAGTPMATVRLPKPIKIPTMAWKMARQPRNDSNFHLPRMERFEGQETIEVLLFEVERVVRT